MTLAATNFRPPSEHYENFPVASWLCPAPLRPAIAAIYWFARTADDIADEGSDTAAQRLEALAAYRAELVRASSGGTVAAFRWPEVFVPLGRAIRQFQLPTGLLADLLNAFEQDIRFTAQGQRYHGDDELIAYCRLSANPVGRLLLHLYRIDDAQSLWQSDQICTALQLINFWQDLGRDIARGRWYPSTEQMERHGVSADDLRHDRPCAGASRMVADYAAAARARMLQGMPLARRIGGRAGWELRLVIAGGLRIVDKMASLDHATWRHRPKLGKRDLPWLLWRAATLPLSGNGAPA